MTREELTLTFSMNSSPRGALLILLLGALLIVSCEKKQMLPSLHWDLSEGHAISAVDWPADVKDDEAMLSRDGPRKLLVKLPKNKVFEATAQSVYVRRSGEKLGSFTVHCPRMRLEAAWKQARDLSAQLQYSTQEIDAWYQDTKQSGGGSTSFSRYYQGQDYACTIKILHSYDRREPWYVSFKLYLETTD